MTELTNDEIRIAIAKAKGWMSHRDGVLMWEAEYSPFGVTCPVDAYLPIPNWPGDIGAAWGLVDEMRGSGFQLYEPDPVDGVPHDWCCCLYLDGMGTLAEAYADTAPRAICLAWLQWQEARGGEDGWNS